MENAFEINTGRCGSQCGGVPEWLYSKYEKDITKIPLELVCKLKDCKDIDINNGKYCTG